MSVKVDKYGGVNLLDLFTKKQAEHIFSGSISKSDYGTVKIYFYDLNGNTIVPKPRKRGKAKKA